MSAQPSEQEFECAICKDCYTKPCCIQPCQHVYCFDCLQNLCLSLDPYCPQCRCYIESTSPAPHIERLMSRCIINCSDCNNSVPASKMKQHKSICPAVQRMQQILTQSAPTVLGAQSNVPNRSTFFCPYCNKANLLRDQLIQHCSNDHHNDLKKVVCPICASMPWGNQNLKSSNFLRHLHTRHKFDYDTYVDFEQDDDAMLHLAVQASLDDF
ncbi:RING finger protein 166 [Biomphalaria pfeifferi]|uniref:RING finger protein 166 n=1 Tax=Biomphalaria pfeifferi TaxID=112525 RepID=A0AAD8BWB8_BIOPF|nr:RING finger protein 166 [Biomphalaria pfeifferi]